MPQWTPRLLSSQRTTETHPNMDPSLSSFLPNPHRRAPSQLSEADVLESASNIPVLLTRDLAASYVQDRDGQQRPSRHGRSMSHPFPSIFHSRKKRDGSTTVMAFDTSRSEGPSCAASQSPAKVVPSKSSKAADRDLRTGKCMTCDSTVRWPKELKVFRCTVCLTINDLMPLSTSSSHRAKDRGDSSDAAPTLKGLFGQYPPAKGLWDSELIRIEGVLTL